MHCRSFQSGTPVSNIDPALINSGSAQMVDPLGVESSLDKPSNEATESTSTSVSSAAIFQFPIRFVYLFFFLFLGQRY